MNTKRIVVTGAPGTGKTSIIKGLEAKGFQCFHEVIRSMTAAARNDKTSGKPISNPLVFVKDPQQFNLNLLKGRTKQFEEAKNLNVEACFFDRGIPDVLAYMEYFKQEYGNEFIQASTKNRYDSVLILPPWKDIYVSDNERLETFKESEELHHHLVETYARFGFNPITIPKLSVQERVDFILGKLNLV